jgi:hypothetical protein
MKNYRHKNTFYAGLYIKKMKSKLSRGYLKRSDEMNCKEGFIYENQ